MRSGMFLRGWLRAAELSRALCSSFQVSQEESETCAGTITAVDYTGANTDSDTVPTCMQTTWSTIVAPSAVAFAADSGLGIVADYLIVLSSSY